MSTKRTHNCCLYAIIAGVLLVSAVLLGWVLAHPADAAPGLWRVMAVEEVPSEDVLQQCAVKALRGDYGPLASWQRAAYLRVLDQGLTVRGRIFLTAYWDAEGHDSRWDCRGGRCGEKHLACNRLPLDTVVWLTWPVKKQNKQTGEWYIVNWLSQLRVVLDRGGKGNDSVADELGCDLWADRHTAGPYPTQVGRYAVIGERQEAPRG